MRKLIYLSVIVGLLFAGCEPNEELYKELDKEKEPYSDNIEDSLTSDDYSTIKELALAKAKTAEDSSKANSIENYESFSSSRSPENYIPLYLSEEYKALDKGSNAKVTYNFYVGEPEYLSKFGSADVYTLNEEDYDSMGEEEGEPGYYDNFSSSTPPEEFLPGFLEENFTDVEEGELIGITYDYYKGEVVEMTDYYQYKDGSWELVPNVYVLTEEDYNSMGEPGNYNNFSSSADPNDYLPIFLKEKFPYASKGDKKVVVYNYYNGSYVEVRAKEYNYDGEKWNEFEDTKVMTDQFIHNGDTWVFDPTVSYTMEGDDYQLIVDERESKYVDGYGTGEYYSGANSYHGNFDIRLSSRLDYDDTFEDLSDEEAEEIIWERILFLADEPMETRGALHVMLQKKFPEAKPTSNGVEVFYEITFTVFTKDYSSINYTATYQCIEAGNPGEDKLPEFEFVETDAPYNGE
ncbi:MAG: hypothetical protein ACOC8S_03380 [Bacteroidota bacterium]